MNGRGRILTGSTEVTLIRPVPDPQFCVITAGNRGIFHRNAEGNVEIKEGEGMVVLEADRWRIWSNPWQWHRKF